MPASTHHVERLTLEVEVGDMGAAMDLRDRVEQLAGGMITQTLERLLEELAPADLTLRLDKIELDLGAFDHDRIEADAPAALERALRQALAQAIAAARNSGGGAQTPDEAALADFEAYLVRGAVPFGGAGLPPREALRALIATQPQALVRMLRRRAGARHVLERLALQVGEADLASLLAVLAPAEAAVILAYLAELGRLHAATAAPPIAEPALRQVLRVLTFEYLLRDPGGAFNRERYVEALVRGLAQAHGLTYGDLLALLQAALPATRRRRPVAGSLPGVLAQLAEETDDARPETPAPENDVIERAAGGDLSPLLAALRTAVGRPAALDQLVRRLDGRIFAAVIAALEPAHAEVILTYVAGLSEAHQARPLLPLSEVAFELRLRRLALRFLFQDAGSSFNRRVWLRRLLKNLARESGIGYVELLTALMRVVEVLGTQTPPRGALPAALSALAADLPQARGRILRLAQGAAQVDEDPLDRLAAAERFLRSGAPSAMGPELAGIAVHRPAAFADMLRRLTRAASDAPGALIERLLSWMAPDEIAKVLWPTDADGAAQWAGHLVEAEGLDMSSAWMRVLASGLKGEALAPPAAVPELSRSVRDALLRHWLDQGVLAWWAPPGVTIEYLQGDLAARPAAALIALFADHEPGRVTARLRRAMTSADGEGETLLRTLAPWAFSRGGADETLGAGPSGAALVDLRLHAAAAAVVGGAVDLTAPAEPDPLPPRPAAPGLSTPSEDAVLFAWIKGEGPASAPGLAEALGRRLSRGGGPDPQLDAALRRGLGRPEARARMAAVLPHALLAHLLRRIAPGQARFIDDLIAVLSLASSKRGGQAGRILWTTVLALLTSPPSPRVLADRLIAALATGADGEALRTAAAKIARRHGHAHLTAALAAPRNRTLEPPATRAPPGPEPGETHYLANAGLVLFNPFLPRFFETLGVLSAGEDGVQRIVGLEAGSRAAHLLQYLVDERTDAPETELILNKVLCGLAPAEPIAPGIDLTEADRAVCDSLLSAVIGNWTMISNTSLAGLRETFLQREGRLRRADERWSLEVERKTVDILTDQIPWSMAVVYHRWMPDPVHVTW